MDTTIDPSNDLQSQDEDVLFRKISNELLKQGYSISIKALPLILANELYALCSTILKDSFEQASTGRGKEHQHNTLQLSQSLSWITNNSEVSNHWLKWSGDLQNDLNQHLFLGLFRFESHFARFSEDDFYRRHYDAFKGESSRKLSIVVYLNHDWRPEDGGELVLYQSDTDPIGIKVVPDFGTVVVFLSEECPHEVLPAHRDRYSISGWYSPNSLKV